MADIRPMPDFSPRSATPGVCLICKRTPGRSNPRVANSPQRPVIDLDTWIEGEGNLEVCQDCATEIGAAVGLVPEPVHSRTVEDLVRATEALEEARASGAEKDQIIDAFAEQVRRRAHELDEVRDQAYHQGFTDAKSGKFDPEDPED